jgi:putative transposase
MLVEEVGQLLNTGYLPLEMGYQKLSDGNYCIASYKQIPGFKSKWVDWLYSYYCRDTNTYISTAPKIHVQGEWDDKWKPGRIIGASHNVKEYLAGEILNLRIQYIDPAKYFEKSALRAANIGVVICADSFLGDGTLHGRFIHVVRDTDLGCEMRSRYWIYNCSEDVAKDMLKNCIDSSSWLKELLKEVVKKQAIYENQENATCKFCNGPDIIKNGSRKNVQLYLCKDCGHSFAANNAPPHMKYPADLISTAVHEYYSGKALHEICRNIEGKMNTLPSDSTICNWITKLTKKALCEVKDYHPKVGNKWIMCETDVQHNNIGESNTYKIISIEDLDTRYLLGMICTSGQDANDYSSLINNAILTAGKIPEQIIISFENYDFIKLAVDNSSKKDIQFITQLEKTNSSPNLYLRNILINRFKYFNPIKNRENIQVLIQGFLFHYNCLTPKDLLFEKTPAEAAGLKIPYKNWLDIGFVN